MEDYKLFLDDIRFPGEVRELTKDPNYEGAWVIVKDFKQFKSALALKGLPKIISFDHDLGDVSYSPTYRTKVIEEQEETGHDCAKALIEYCIKYNYKLPKYLVHSMNPIGKENIIGLLKSFEAFQEREEVESPIKDCYSHD